jgi:hypothetical protein
MKISGSTPPLPPAASQARATRRPDTDAPTHAPAPAPAPATSEPETPTETGKPHGLVRAAEQSNRSDVAALRQWINHPDLRIDLPLPDLSAEHRGNGFEKAVAAYESIIAIGSPPASTEPTPVPAPVVSDPVVSDPDPAVSDPPPVVTEPVPDLPVPAPAVPDADPLLDILLPESTSDEAA